MREIYISKTFAVDKVTDGYNIFEYNIFTDKWELKLAIHNVEMRDMAIEILKDYVENGD